MSDSTAHTTMAHAEPTTSSRGCPEARERSSGRGRDHEGVTTSPRGDGNPELGTLVPSG